MIPGIGRSQTQKVEGLLPGTEVEEDGGLFDRCKVSVWEDEKVREVDSGDGCTRLSVYLMPLYCMFKNG